MCACVHRHTCTHAYIHTYMRTDMHACIHTYIPAYNEWIGTTPVNSSQEPRPRHTRCCQTAPLENRSEDCSFNHGSPTRGITESLVCPFAGSDMEHISALAHRNHGDMTIPLARRRHNPAGSVQRCPRQGLGMRSAGGAGEVGNRRHRGGESGKPPSGPFCTPPLNIQ